MRPAHGDLLHEAILRETSHVSRPTKPLRNNEAGDGFEPRHFPQLDVVTDSPFASDDVTHRAENPPENPMLEYEQHVLHLFCEPPLLTCIGRYGSDKRFIGLDLCRS